MELALRDGRLHASTGDAHWDSLSGKREGHQALRRFPYIPTYLPAWKIYYPNGKVIED